jgi:cytolysin (calcineurin-like family phosphatase)
MDLTFIVTSDTHFGAGNIAASHVRAIEAMNGIAGRPFPSGIDGRAGTPLGVLVSGDLTEDGRPEEWEAFVRHYGTDGRDGMLRYPVYESWGNHDKHYGWYVKKQVEARHGAVRYSWDWHDVHMVCLGEAPDHDDLAWLADDLAATGDDVGVVLYFHFPLAGPFSRDHWFGEGDYKAALKRTIANHRVLGIFHGHFHASGIYRWEGHDIYNVGSPKHGFDDFAVVRVRDDRMTVAAYNYSKGRWWWWHDKPIFDGVGPSQRHVEPGLVGAGR